MLLNDTAPDVNLIDESVNQDSLDEQAFSKKKVLSDTETLQEDVQVLVE